MKAQSADHRGPGRISEAEALWYDTRRWPTFVDGFHHVAKASTAAGPARARSAWDSTPGGRGRVLEKVTTLRAARRPDRRGRGRAITGTQRVSFIARPRRPRRSHASSSTTSSRKRRAARCTRRRRDLHPPAPARGAAAHAVAVRAASWRRTRRAPRSQRPLELPAAYVRLQGCRGRRRDHGRADRPDHRRRRNRRRPQGRQAGVRRRGPDRGPQRHRRPGRPAGQEGEDHPGAGRRPGRGDRRAHPRHHDLRGLRRRRPRHRGRPRAHGDQAGRLRRARRGHARPGDPRLEHLVAVDHRDRRRDPAAREGRRLPLLLPGVGHAADRDRPRRRHLRRDGRGDRSTSPRRSRSSRSSAATLPGSSSTASSTPAPARSGAPRRSAACRSRPSTRPSAPRTSRRCRRSS